MRIRRVIGAWWFPAVATIILGERVFGSRTVWQRRVERGNGTNAAVTISIPDPKTAILAGGLLLWDLSRRHNATA